MTKARQTRPLVHPGMVLKPDLLESLAMNINRLARYFGFTPEYWLNMQAHYDLEPVLR